MEVKDVPDEIDDRIHYDSYSVSVSISISINFLHIHYKFKIKYTDESAAYEYELWEKLIYSTFTKKYFHEYDYLCEWQTNSKYRDVWKSDPLLVGWHCLCMQLSICISWQQMVYVMTHIRYPSD